MATKEPPKSGLLAKVARFVANPTTSWSEVDTPTGPDTLDPRQVDRAAMKALIELKRRNDFVRQREFNMLRKIREKELGNAGENKSPDRPSGFQSSLPSRPDDKAVTLKKINDIEAQMSMQWWSTKHGNSSILNSSIMNSSNFGTSQPSSPTKGGSGTTKPVVKTVTGNSPVPTPATRQSGSDSKSEFINTAAGELLDFTTESIKPHTPVARPIPVADSISWEPPPVAQPLPQAPALRPAPIQPPPSAARPPSTPTLAPPASKPTLAMSQEQPGQTDFTHSKLFAIEVGEVTHDPELEEAAIRFANGDDEGAELALKEALQIKETGLLNEEAWLALFDLYRATGNQNSFDVLAMDYAGYFQRSAPQWVSFPALNKAAQPRPIASDASTAKPSAPHWKSPSAVGLQSVAAIKAVLTKTEAPWRVDWSKIEKIEDGAVSSLIELFRSWSDSAVVQLRLEGANALFQVLEKATPASERGVNTAWWNLRMELLRLCHRPDEFEMVALDFCITYEVSPPAWTPAKCKCKTVDTSGASQHGGFTIINPAISSLPLSVLGDTSLATSLSELPSRQTTIELSGHIHGDPLEAIAILDRAVEGADVIVISCEKLIRIDFSAAGALLNWVISRHQEGRQVQFVQLHRMILAFFHVIGISDHALTSVRIH